MKILLYIFLVFAVPGGILFVAGVVLSARIRHRERARINAITRTALDDMNVSEVMRSQAEPWNSTGPGTGSASNYVPEWAKPEDAKRKHGGSDER